MLGSSYKILKTGTSVGKLRAQVLPRDYWIELNLHVLDTLWPQISLKLYFQSSEDISKACNLSECHVRWRAIIQNNKW